jgi:alpha-beta hydrolase superfamily lysophospholipase
MPPAKVSCRDREARRMKIRRTLINTLALSLGAALAALAGAAPLRANADAPAGPAPSTFTFRNADGGDIFVYRWLPTTEEKASVLIVHGLAEHAGRYDRFAHALNAAGYAVYAADNRGHGRSALPGKLGDGGHDPWNGTERDLAQLEGIIRSKSSKPLFLFGHSLGSAFAQRFSELHGADLSGTILSGTFGVVPNLPAVIGQIDAGAAGAGALQKTIAPSLFATYNKPFENRTGFEWLSRDPAEVDKYVHDPLCGFAVTNEYVAAIFHGFADTWDPANEAKIPVTLPILIMGGDADPVGANTVSVLALADRYDAHGSKDLHVTFYPGGRHEMLNEINRDVVTADVIAWLNEHVKT